MAESTGVVDAGVVLNSTRVRFKTWPEILSKALGREMTRLVLARNSTLWGVPSGALLKKLAASRSCVEVASMCEYRAWTLSALDLLIDIKFKTTFVESVTHAIAPGAMSKKACLCRAMQLITERTIEACLERGGLIPLEIRQPIANNFMLLGPAARHAPLILRRKAVALEPAQIAQVKLSPEFETWRAGSGFSSAYLGIMDGCMYSILWYL
jgi:hypothetical protein